MLSAKEGISFFVLCLTSLGERAGIYGVIGVARVRKNGEKKNGSLSNLL